MLHRGAYLAAPALSGLYSIFDCFLNEKLMTLRLKIIQVQDYSGLIELKVENVYCAR